MRSIATRVIGCFGICRACRFPASLTRLILSALLLCVVCQEHAATWRKNGLADLQYTVLERSPLGQNTEKVGDGNFFPLREMLVPKRWLGETFVPQFELTDVTARELAALTDPQFSCAHRVVRLLIMQ